LELSACKLGDDSVEGLARGRNLDRLGLPLNPLSAEGVAALMRLPLTLTHLDLSGISLTEEVLQALGSRTGLPELRVLVLDERTAVPNGERDIWYDQGMAIGESPAYFDIRSLQERYFSGWTTKIVARDL
jgi:hypothetical protein